MSPSRPVRVLLVDDSALALTMLTRMLGDLPDVEIVATARNGLEALAAVQEHDPAVVLTDLHMPVMDGLEFTRRLMSSSPRPILVVSTALRDPDSPMAFQSLEAGAVDLFPKPGAGTPEELEAARQELLRKIRILAGVRVFRRPPTIPTGGSHAPQPSPGSLQIDTVRLVVVGASTGGPQALRALFSGLTPRFPAPILCVQHISDGFLEGLAGWLRGHLRIQVRIASEEEFARPGTLYFPKEGHHLRIDARGRLTATLDAPISGHRPSITVTMRSAAEAFGPAAMGLLLTGMGEDGVDGLAAIQRCGGITMAQDQASCVVYGMPARAVERGAAKLSLPPDEMSRILGSLEQDAHE